MELIENEDIEKAKKMIKKGNNSFAVMGMNDIFNRKMIEYGKFDVLISPERGKRKDGLKYLDSGLNSVIAKIAAKNRVSLGIDLKEIRMLQKKDKAIRIARIMQNIKICRKADAKIKAIGFNDYRNGECLLISLGASTKQAKEAISF